MKPKRQSKACAECGQVKGHYDDCAIGMGGASAEWKSSELNPSGPVIVETVWLNPETHSALQSAQAYAHRVWHGQSISADRNWRIERVKQALEGQGMSMDGVELP